MISFDVERPPSFSREHVVLRIALLIVIGWMVHPLGLLWLGLPVIAAALISQKGGRRYVDDDGPAVARALSWIVAFAAYLALLTDELPPGGGTVRLDVERSGSPTVGSALLRILFAIPSVLALSVLTFVGTIVWMVAAVFVLVDGRYPEGMWQFLRGVVRWEARTLAYLASLVERYPPFTLEAVGD
jgi:Domain of unknown function (DUF4389)